MPWPNSCATPRTSTCPGIVLHVLVELLQRKGSELQCRKVGHVCFSLHDIGNRSLENICLLLCSQVYAVDSKRKK